MNILIIGGGAREHALAWKISKSAKLANLFICPGNPGSEMLAKKIDGRFLTDNFNGLKDVLQKNSISLGICGPEQPLVDGISEIFKELHIPFFGPDSELAQLEGSKSFAKQVMEAAGIPTASYKLAGSQEETLKMSLQTLAAEGSVVIKADGLAAGKGVFVCKSKEDVISGVDRLFNSSMAKAAEHVVVESCLIGREVSYFTMLGPSSAVPLGFAVDFKRLADGDIGPNTGGMGAYTPAEWLPEDAQEQVENLIVKPLVSYFSSKDKCYSGFLYVGLMWSEAGPKVIEFNVRLGDPEAQILAFNDDRDWLELINSCLGIASNEQPSVPVKNTNKKTVGVVLAAEGYPYDAPNSEPRIPCEELLSAQTAKDIDVGCFLASVKKQSNQYLAGKGRVMTVVASDQSFKAARLKVYDSVKSLIVNWDKAQFRTDIAANADKKGVL